jgi:putative GTP pyrophosphokinase
MQCGGLMLKQIQLRTQAQDVRAYLEHGLIYKPVIRRSPEIARKVARLSVLVEMFDE